MRAVSKVSAFLPMLAAAVHAGFPSPAADYAEEEIDLQKLLIRNRPATFLVRVEGDSMSFPPARLFSGDLAVVDRSLDPRHGDVVVVDVDGDRSFKLWLVEDGRPRLAFSNPTMPVFEIDPAAIVEVWGVVSSSVNPRRRAAG